jgi:hypothetical protein
VTWARSPPQPTLCAWVGRVDLISGWYLPLNARVGVADEIEVPTVGILCFKWGICEVLAHYFAGCFVDYFIHVELLEMKK